MKRSMMTTTLGALALFTATGALASERTTDALSAELRDARQRVAARAWNEKGYPRTRLDMERIRLGSLIRDLEAGRNVDPREIDRAIERANDAELGR
jgi:hypothetical protein